jgi:Amt family ammonium transporter
MRRRFLAAIPLVLLAMLVVPHMAFADPTDLQNAVDGGDAFDPSVGTNTMWVIVAACLVMFMQAGFAFLEIGFSRAKNAGTVVAKILTNFSIAAICWWAVGFAFAFGGPLGSFIGHDGGFFFTHLGTNMTPGVDGGLPTFHDSFPVMSLSNATLESKWFFQFVFCAVSLAIVWGTTLERIKFGVYIIYSVIFASVIYPIGAHWVFGGGFLQTGDLWRVFGVDDFAKFGMQDFAGSTAVHLIGATGALAALLLLGPRRGKYGPDGKPRAIPGHNMPLFGLGVLILWLGWFGFNPGSTLNAADGRFAEILFITNLAAAAGVLTAVLTAYLKGKTIDIGMAGNGAIAALVAITAPSGYVEIWAAPIIGAVAGVIVVLGVYWVDKYIDDPLMRDLHGSTSGPIQRVRRSRRRTLVLGQLHSARGPGCRLHSRLLVRFHNELQHLLAHQEDVRSPCDSGRRGCGYGHLRTWDVRIPRAVHPRHRVPGRNQWTAARRQAGDQRHDVRLSREGIRR